MRNPSKLLLTVMQHSQAKALSGAITIYDGVSNPTHFVAFNSGDGTKVVLNYSSFINKELIAQARNSFEDAHFADLTMAPLRNILNYTHSGFCSSSWPLANRQSETNDTELSKVTEPTDVRTIAVRPKSCSIWPPRRERHEIAHPKFHPFSPVTSTGCT